MDDTLLNDFEDIDYLSDIFSLEEAHFGIVKENIRYNHMMNIPNTPHEILTEAFADVIQKMGDFFKKMIVSIKEFFRKLFMYINASLMSIDKFVKKYKKELDKVDKVDFEVYGYEFTFQEEPTLDELEKIVNGYNDDIMNVNKLKVAELKTEQNEYLSNANLCKLRGNILGSGQSIEEDDFMETVRKYYRNGESESTAIKIDLSTFRDAVSNAGKDVKDMKAAEKLRDQFIIALNKAEKFFDQKVPLMYKEGEKSIDMRKAKVEDKKFNVTDDKVYISDSKRDVVNQLVRLRYNQTRTVSAMVNIVVRERANAYKDKVKMTKEIIQKALFNKNTDTSIGEDEKAKEDDD